VLRRDDEKQPTSNGGSGAGVFLSFFGAILFTTCAFFGSHDRISGKHEANFTLSLIISSPLSPQMSLPSFSAFLLSTATQLSLWHQ
jgi:hypothetical protein